MYSIRSIFKNGNGPSSSHTMGPKNAAVRFMRNNPKANRFVVELYGSLALTGKGHLTDFILKKTLGFDNTEVVFKEKEFLDKHPNGMIFYGYCNDELLDKWTVYSIGGGEISDFIKQDIVEKDYYSQSTMKDILKYCQDKNITLLEYILENEEEDIRDYAISMLHLMFSSVEVGLEDTADLPGDLHLKRRARRVFNHYLQTKDFDSFVFASALAVSENNASGGEVVTAPTCGSAGVIPGVFYPLYKTKKFSIEKLSEALLIAGLIGDLIKTNASISGAQVGCQGEVGAACSMASAAICYLYDGTNEQIEYAAEIGLEHYLGMTCDPVGGYVQIPCIERNAISAKRAFDCANYAILSDGNHYITLDMVINAMNNTGKDLDRKYKETSLGGLANFDQKTSHTC